MMHEDRVGHNLTDGRLRNINTCSLKAVHSVLMNAEDWGGRRCRYRRSFTKQNGGRFD